MGNPLHYKRYTFPRFTSFRSVIIRFISSFTRSHWLAHSFSHSTISLIYLFFLFFPLSLRLHFALYLSFRSIPFHYSLHLRSAHVSFVPHYTRTGLSLHLWEAPKLYSLRSCFTIPYTSFRSCFVSLHLCSAHYTNKQKKKKAGFLSPAFFTILFLVLEIVISFFQFSVVGVLFIPCSIIFLCKLFPVFSL